MRLVDGKEISSKGASVCSLKLKWRSSQIKFPPVVRLLMGSDCEKDAA